ncbi:MAG: hypothetical protein IJS39_07640 [Synergistaceae bacterium]|nr:hypothetical protein [Synergistaceae bacterium]
MMKKLLLACMILVMGSVSAIGEEYDISGLWNIEGEGFAEKSFVRVSLALDGDMTLTTASTQEVLDNAVSQDLVRQEYADRADILSGDVRFLTGYDIHLKITATNLDISAWSDHLPNGIRIPVPLPTEIPSASYPYELPVQANIDGLNYKVTLTSAVSGKVRITGYADFDVIGSTEINSECLVWKNGTPKPQSDGSSSSGCDSGFLGLYAVMMPVIFAGVKKLVRN